MTTSIDFNQGFFNTVLRSQAINTLVKQRAEAILAEARRAAPVDSGDYKRGLALKRVPAQYRDVWQIVGTDWKTMLVESKTGNLARALKTAGRR